MHVDLIDHLRCPRTHEESALVASIDRADGRDIETGSLGCPVCLAHYPIQGFVADFAGAMPSGLPFDDESMQPDDAGVMRAAALLDARVPGSWYLLFGAWGSLAAALVVSFDVRCVLLNPRADVAPADGVSMLRVADRLPLAPGWAAGAALDGAAAQSPPLVEGARYALRAGARLVAPAASPLPREVLELARDESWWVAEHAAPVGPPIPLRRVSR